MNSLLFFATLVRLVLLKPVPELGTAMTSSCSVSFSAVPDFSDAYKSIEGLISLVLFKGETDNYITNSQKSKLSILAKIFLNPS